MPFKSQAQRRKFSELLVKGKISNDDFRRVESRDGSGEASGARQAQSQGEIQKQEQKQEEGRVQAQGGAPLNARPLAGTRDE